jgi:L-malate glycosyltransferase
MKIFQIIQKPQKRGAELFAALLSEELQKLGHEIILISLFEGSAQLPFTGRQIHLQRPLQKRLWDWKAWKSLAELIRTEKPDLIQANAADTLKFTVISRICFGWTTPIVFRNASIISDYISNLGIRSINNFLLNQVEGIASVSEASQSDMINFFKLDRPFIQVIPIGVEAKVVAPSLPKEGEKQLVHIGGFTFEKNQKELLDIFQQLFESDSNYHLKLIGDGPLRNQIEEQVKAKGLEKQVEFLGNVSQPFSHIPKNAVLLLTSKIEGLPAVILEAMLHKIPVVAYGVGGIPEVLRTGQTGWCITPNDSQAFAQAIQEVMTMQEEVKQQILDQAYQLVSTHYSLPQISLQFVQFYKSILK